ncbi:MAG: glycosyltransferase family 2 protein [Candidatus Parcubacteria bacterium]|nr:glycosyltransferase family 2 protein [Candidatus Parcubacteria bacterium]
MNDSPPKIAIVIPAYNEASVLPKVLDDLLQYFKPENILVVDDGSTDATSLAAEGKKIKVIQHFLNRGTGAATKTGLVYAFDELKADLAVTFDADGQHDHNDILGLINPIVQGEADVVLGSRFLNKQSLPLFRRLANYGANFFTWLLFGLWVSDSQSGFKALSRQAWQKIEINGDRFEVCSEIIAEIKRNKLRYKPWRI